MTPRTFSLACAAAGLLAGFVIGMVASPERKVYVEKEGPAAAAATPPIEAPLPSTKDLPPEVPVTPPPTSAAIEAGGSEALIEVIELLKAENEKLREYIEVLKAKNREYEEWAKKPRFG